VVRLGVNRSILLADADSARPTTSKIERDEVFREDIPVHLLIDQSIRFRTRR
jgi:hypothetical protein